MRSILSISLLVLGVAACETTQPPPFTEVSGTYRLQTVGESVVVFLRPEGRTTAEALSGTLTLLPDGHLHVAYRVRLPDGDEVDTSLSGSYTLGGDGTARLRYDSGDQESATVSGDRLTIATQHGGLLVFERVQ